MSTSIMQSSEPLFTVRQVAERLKRSYLTIFRAIKNGHLQTHRIGREHSITDKQIQDWLASGGKTTQKAEAETD